MDPDDPERFKKNVEATVAVSTRIHRLAVKKRGSLKIESKEERIEKILVSLFLSSNSLNYN